MREGYDTAQVCVNGNVTTATALTAPDRRKDFCPTCGERTMMQCPSCEEPIQGYYDSRSVVGYAPYRTASRRSGAGKASRFATQVGRRSSAALS